MTHEDLQELRADVKELVKQGAIHNELLRTHEARSLALQTEQKLQAQEILPLKEHVRFVSSFLKWTGGLLATATAALIVQILIRLIW
jgi:hypothetical protein